MEGPRATETRNVPVTPGKDVFSSCNIRRWDWETRGEIRLPTEPGPVLGVSLRSSLTRSPLRTETGQGEDRKGRQWLR